MSDERPYLITPPPGLLPEPPQQPETESATHRIARPAPRPADGTPPAGADALPVFLPKPPGAAPIEPVATKPPAPAAPTAPVELVETKPPAPAAPAETKPPALVEPEPAAPAELVETELGGSRELPPIQPVDTPAAPHRTWTLELPDGTRRPLVRTLVLGRTPTPDGAHPDAGTLALTDPAKTVSKTHAALEPRGAELLVHDLGSTNGTLVQPAPGVADRDQERGGPATPAAPTPPGVLARPGSPVPVTADATVSLGEYRIRLRLQP